MLLATQGVDSTSDLGKPMVGVASVWQVIFVLVRVRSKLVLGMKAIRTFYMRNMLVFIRVQDAIGIFLV